MQNTVFHVDVEKQLRLSTEAVLNRSLCECALQVELLEFIGTVKPDETSLDRKTKLQALQTLKEGGLVPQSELTAAKQSILMVS